MDIALWSQLHFHKLLIGQYIQLCPGINIFNSVCPNANNCISFFTKGEIQRGAHLLPRNSRLTLEIWNSVHISTYPASVTNSDLHWQIQMGIQIGTESDGLGLICGLQCHVFYQNAFFGHAAAPLSYCYSLLQWEQLWEHCSFEIICDNSSSPKETQGYMVFLLCRWWAAAVQRPSGNILFLVNCFTWTWVCFRGMTRVAVRSHSNANLVFQNCLDKKIIFLFFLPSFLVKAAEKTQTTQEGKWHRQKINNEKVLVKMKVEESPNQTYPWVFSWFAGLTRFTLYEKDEQKMKKRHDSELIWFKSPHFWVFVDFSCLCESWDVSSRLLINTSMSRIQIFWLNPDWDSPVNHPLHSSLDFLGVLEVPGVPALQGRPAERPWVTTCRVGKSLTTLAMPTQQPHTTLQIKVAGGEGSCKEDG